MLTAKPELWSAGAAKLWTTRFRSCTIYLFYKHNGTTSYYINKIQVTIWDSGMLKGVIEMGYDLQINQTNIVVNLNMEIKCCLIQLKYFLVNMHRYMVLMGGIYPKEAESSSDGTEWGSSALGKRALQIWSYWPLEPSLFSPSMTT